ncbi:MAG: phosphodiester glycosidase family protein [Armatimonadota bacterium]|nr:phosphodiester glycosidase family protein [Armatimonadota bacterium]
MKTSISFLSISQLSTTRLATRNLAVATTLLGSAVLASAAQAAGTAITPLPTPLPLGLPSLPVPKATPVPPPTAQAYVAAEPAARVSDGQVMVPLPFLMNGLGASAGLLSEGCWRIMFFEHTVDLYVDQHGARFDEQPVTLPVAPTEVNGTLYVPWQPLADLFGVKWRIMPPALATTKSPTKNSKPAKTTFLLQYPAAYIESIRTMVMHDKVRLIVGLSNATRIVAAQSGSDVQFQLAAARRSSSIPTVHPVNDYLVSRAVTRSGNWRANLAVRVNYSAPIQWFTFGNPPRLVIDVQRLFEERSTRSIGGGLSMLKIRKGTSHGPVQMFVVRVDPRDGWRVRVAPGGYSVLQRAPISRIASRHKALVGINGGFFSYDGAAVGAVLVNGEWLRLPWRGRTAIGFRPDGTARIGNLQARAHAEFSSGIRLPVRDLNGWPDPNTITAITTRFGGYIKLRPGEIAVVVQDGQVIGKPGSGIASVYPGGFTLIANGGARPWLNKVKRGESAKLKIHAVGWEGFTSALGGGPRLLKDGQLQVTDLREAFRADVRVGLGPRTAMGIDKEGRYIIVVVDGRQKFYSTGLTLTELAYTMQQLGAVDALNLDGGGSTAMVVANRVINRPSDGYERRVANALLVMQ